MVNKREIIRDLKVISIKIKSIIDKKLCDNITDIQMFILLFLLQNNNEIFQKDIENMLKVRRSTTTGILNIMENNGLIVRINSFDDKRKKIIHLSSKGMKYVEEFKEYMLEVEDNLFNEVTFEECELFF